MAEGPAGRAPAVLSALRAIVADPAYGPGALSDPLLVSKLLRIHLPPGFPPADRELIVAAARSGLADTLRQHLADGLDPDAAVRLTAATFSADTGATRAASSQVARQFAAAMGVHGQLRSAASAASAAPPGHAFICYVREDAAEVGVLQARLESAGIRVWRDTVSLWPGQNWRAEIRRAISQDALVFLACFSRNSETRYVSYQNEELTLAVEQLRLRRPDDEWLIPVRLDDCEIPDLNIGGGRTLSSIQHADLFGAQREQGMERLVAAVWRILSRSYP